MNINIKTKEEIEIMREGGAKLARVKKALKDKVAVGVNAMEVENLANELIKKEGGKPSFKMVEDYQWATCINVNDGVVHGIPKKSMVFSKDDLVSVDVGMCYKDFHTDTSFSVYLGKNPQYKKMIKNGRETLDKAISQARPGNKIKDIAQMTETELTKHGYKPIKALVGHGVGRELHEEPMVPCYVSGSPHEDVEIVEGMTLAIEIMYTEGSPNIKLDSDGWTLATKDGKIASLFEETVAVLANGPVILTR